MSRSKTLSRPNGPPSFAAVHRGRSLTAVALLALTAVVGCSGNPDSAAPTERGTSAVPATVRSTLPTASMPSGTSGAPGTTTGTIAGFSSDQQAVIAGHDAAIKAIDEARAKSDPNDPALATVLAHDMLRDTRIDIDQRTKQGMASKRPTDSKSRIEYLTVSIDGTTAALTTCEVDDAIAYRVADGSIVNDKVTTGRWAVSMSQLDGVWQLAGRQRQASWPGEEMDACRGAN